MLRKFFCWLTGHDWTYVCSFTGWPTGGFPFGGFRARCRRCQQVIRVRYPERMEFRVEKENGDG